MYCHFCLLENYSLLGAHRLKLGPIVTTVGVVQHKVITNNGDNNAFNKWLTTRVPSILHLIALEH
jgi:predicted transcriptional regulator